MGEILAGLAQASSAVGAGVNSALGIPAGVTFGNGAKPPEPQLSGAPLPPPTEAVPSTPSEAIPQGGNMSMPLDQAMDAGAVGPSEAQPPQMTTAEPFDNNHTTYDDAEEIQGDTWKPKKATPLGQIADTLLMLRGRAPAFQNQKNKESLVEALQGWQKDPDQALGRLRKVAPEQVGAYANSFADYKTEIARQKGVAAQTLERGGRILGGMFGAILKTEDDDEAAKIYGDNLATLRRYGEAYGYTPDMIPEKFDRKAIETVRGAGISVFQQERLGQYDQQIENKRNEVRTRLGQFQQRLEQQGANTQSMIEHRTESRGETNRHNLESEGIAQQKARNASTPEALGPDNKPMSQKNALKSAKDGTRVFSEEKTSDGYAVRVIRFEKGKPVPYTHVGKGRYKKEGLDLK